MEPIPSTITTTKVEGNFQSTLKKKIIQGKRVGGPSFGIGKVVGDCKPDDFSKDTTYFASKFGLSNEGENACQIIDLFEEKLLEVFGKDSKIGRSGFKLRKETCIIPYDDIIHLS